MPELPDITIYVERLAAYTVGRPLKALRLASPFLLRSVDPPVREIVGRTITSVSRLGKRIVLGFEDDLYAVIHLMIAGRLRWKPAGTKVPGKIGLAAFDFSTGTLTMTEAGTKRRASLHVVRGEDALRAMDRGGVDVNVVDLPTFRAAMLRESHTLKRSLTDPRILDGIGNA